MLPIVLTLFLFFPTTFATNQTIKIVCFIFGANPEQFEFAADIIGVDKNEMLPLDMDPLVPNYWQKTWTFLSAPPTAVTAAAWARFLGTPNDSKLLTITFNPHNISPATVGNLPVDNYTPGSLWKIVDSGDQNPEKSGKIEYNFTLVDRSYFVLLKEESTNKQYSYVMVGDVSKSGKRLINVREWTIYKSNGGRLEPLQNVDVAEILNTLENKMATEKQIVGLAMQIHTPVTQNPLTLPCYNTREILKVQKNRAPYIVISD